MFRGCKGVSDATAGQDYAGQFKTSSLTFEGCGSPRARAGTKDKGKREESEGIGEKSGVKKGIPKRTP